MAESSKYQDADTLRDLYVEQGMAAKAVGEELGTTETTVLRWLRHHDIPVRSPGPSDAGDTAMLKDADALRALYLEDELTVRKIASELDTHHSTVQYWLSKHGISPRASASVQGERSPFWKGGRDKHRGPAWDRTREDVIEAHDGECVCCGLDNETHKEEYGRSLDVHHIQPYREFDSAEEANREANLIPLCIPCHNRWEGVPLSPDVS